jgi:hypothetical protein
MPCRPIRSLTRGTGSAGGVGKLAGPQRTVAQALIRAGSARPRKRRFLPGARSCRWPPTGEPPRRSRRRRSPASTRPPRASPSARCRLASSGAAARPRPEGPASSGMSAHRAAVYEPTVPRSLRAAPQRQTLVQQVLQLSKHLSDGPLGASKVRLLIVSKRHPAGFPLRDLGGSVVQRLRRNAVGSRRQSTDSWPLSWGAACELARVGPGGVSATPWTRYRCAETTQSDYGRPLGSVRMIVLFVPHAAG